MTDVGNLVNFPAQMYVYSSRVSMQWTMQPCVLPSRFVLCWRRYVVSWNHGVVFASHSVQLGLDISQTRLLPLEKWETKSKVIPCSLCVYSLIKVIYGEQAGGWEVMLKKWQLAARVDSCKTNSHKGNVLMQQFPVRPDKGVSTSQFLGGKKTCKWRDEQENTSYMTSRTLASWRRLMIGGFCIQAEVHSKRTSFPFYLVVSSCAQRQNLTEKQHKASKKQSFLPSLGLTVCICWHGAKEHLLSCWEEIWKTGKKTVNAVIRDYTCFFGRPLNSSSNCSTSWAPGASSLFTQKTVEEVSQHSLIGSSRWRRIRAEPSFNCDSNDKQNSGGSAHQLLFTWKW